MASGARTPRAPPAGALFTRPQTLRYVNIRTRQPERGPLADIFVSCSRLDQERVKPVVDRLGSLGYSVWWDKRERTGRAHADEVESQIESARAVLALWSASARNSTWVWAEAARALDAGKLAQARLDAIELPPPFDALEVADLSGARGAWGPLEDTLARIVRGAAPAQSETPKLGPLATPTGLGAPKLIAIAISAGLAAYAGAMSATYNGVMTTEQLQLALLGVLAVGVVSTAVSAQRLIALSRAGG